MKKAAFTLAEVLVTLGIIGVIAALTMPSLVMHHKKRVVETRLAKFYSNINQAITMSEVENGDKKDWLRMEILDDNGESVNDDTQAITSEEWFNKYLAKYINVIKTEKSETALDCYIQEKVEGAAHKNLYAVVFADVEKPLEI